MIFDVIFIRVNRTKLSNPTHAAKVILIIMQALVLSSMIKVFLTQVCSVGYIEKLIESGNMKMVYLLPIIPSSVFTHFLYREQRVGRLVDKYRKYSNIQLNLRLVFSMCILMLLIFLNAIVNNFI